MPTTVVDLLRGHTAARPDDRAYLFVEDDPSTPATMTYGELDRAARAVAATLAGRGVAGQPVLLLYPPGPGYVTGFLGCLYAGAVAVPAYPPEPARLGRTLPRLRALAADCGARVALSLAGLVSQLPAIGGLAPELAGLDWIATDELGTADAERWRPPAGLDGAATALLQYTSGSTGTPRGVLLSHANLLHNAGLVRTGFGTTAGAFGVSWLPPYHDMGLIGGILQPLFAGFPVALMSPLAFLRRPMLWLETVSRHRATMSGGPNFAFDLCVRKSTPAQRAALDLSAWTVAFSGAEPVRAETLDRFAEAFAPAGFRPEAFYPCYGLAEATLIVTGGQPPRRSGDGRVSCGRPLGGQRLVIVDPATGTACPAGAEGEIWLAGPSVAAGYWRRPEQTGQTFDARLADDPHRYLRTGDLGYLDERGELVVTGRLKDLIIVRGRNLYPQDLEHAVEQRVPGVRPGSTAAFPVTYGGQERVGIACELSAPDRQPPAPGDPGAPTGQPDRADRCARAATAVRQALAETAEVAAAVVVLLAPGQLPKTSSGKLQRYACRRAVESGQWHVDHDDVWLLWRERTTDGAEAAEPPVRTRPVAPATGPVPPELTRLVAGVLGMPAGELAADRPLTAQGLDSLRAVELRELLRTRCGLAVPLSRLLTGVTPAELAAGDCGPTDPTPSSGPGPGHRPTDEDDRGVERPATDGQRALWLIQRSAPESIAYQISRAARISSAVDVGALERALRAAVGRHPALRTSLPARDGVPVQRRSAWSGPVLVRHDVSGLAEPALRERVQADADRPFDLDHGPLWRAALYTRTDTDHVLLLSVHHVVTDFWSLSVLVDELLTDYARQAAPTASSLELFRRDPGESGGISPRSAGSMAAPAPDLASHLDYWRERLADPPPALELPTSYPRPRLQSYAGDSHRFQLPAQTLRGLDRFATAAGLTRFAVLAAGFAAVLARYAGEPELILGTPTAGRGGADRDRLGYLVNPVPLRIRVPAGASLRELADQVREQVIGALEHPVPFPRLVEELRPVRDPARPPLAQVMLVLQQPPAGRADLAGFAVGDPRDRRTLGGLDLRPYPLAEHGSGFDLSVTLAEVAGGLTGTLTYCRDLFDPPAMARLAGHVTGLLARAAEAPEAPLSGLDLPTGPERAELLAWSTGPATPLAGRSLVDRLADVARERPEAIAVVAGAQRLSYRELAARAGQLAARLAGRGVRRGDLVGVHLPRGVDAVVGFWAALLAGAGYLPLPADLPGRRLAWLLADARPAVLLTHRGLAGQLPAGAPPALCLDQPDPAAPTGTPARVGPPDLAYVLYTSGSTGRPKAVMLDHRGAVNLVDAETSVLRITPESRVLQLASAGYDVHVAEILDAHLAGAALYLPPAAATVPGRPLADLLAAERITHLCVSPSVLAALPEVPLPELTDILCGGEACPPEVVARWAPGRRFWNGYGPAETTVCATLGGCTPDGRRPSIGRPLPNLRAYVLDERLRPVPVGVPGELCVGGVGVGWGYLGRPGLTGQRFLPDPYDPRPGARLYRTGDRARWLPGGSLDFLGRLDDQVKIRGTRIEPGEVAARVRELLGDGWEVAVVARPGAAGADELVAYLAGGRPRPPVAELRARLRAELPGAWLPAAFVHLDRLPLNRSGKLDRRALPAPTAADRGAGTGRLAPRGELETLVAQVWADVLGVGSVGVRDHFFDELGGSSLLVARVTDALARRLARPVPVTWLFEHPTVESLAGRLAADPGTTAAAVTGDPAVPDSAGPDPATPRPAPDTAPPDAAAPKLAAPDTAPPDAAAPPGDRAQAEPAPEEQAARRRRAMAARRGGPASAPD